MCGQHRGVRRRGQQPHGRAARGGRVCTKASRTKRRVAPRGRAKTRARARALTCVFFLCGRASGKGHRPRSTSRPPAGASGVHTTRTPCPGTPTHACCVAKAPFIPSMAGAAPSTDAGLPHPAPPAVDTPARAFKFAIDRGGTFCDVFAEVRVGERKRVSSTRGFSQPPPGSARFAPCPTLNLLSLPLFLQCPDGRGGTKYRCERGRRRESARACELLTDPVSAFSLTPSLSIHPPPPPPSFFFFPLTLSPKPGSPSSCLSTRPTTRTRPGRASAASWRRRRAFPTPGTPRWTPPASRACAWARPSPPTPCWSGRASGARSPSPPASGICSTSATRPARPSLTWRCGARVSCTRRWWRWRRAWCCPWAASRAGGRASTRRPTRQPTRRRERTRPL